MPKPTDHPGHGSGKASPKTVDKWFLKGWAPLFLPKGTTVTDPVAIDVATQDLSVLGQVFGNDGVALKGSARPHFRTVDDDAGVVFEFTDPLAEDTTILYRIEDAEEAESEEAPAVP